MEIARDALMNLLLAWRPILRVSFVCDIAAAAAAAGVDWETFAWDPEISPAELEELSLELCRIIMATVFSCGIEFELLLRWFRSSG